MTVRWLDHTADDGFIVEAGDLDLLFAEAADALAAMILADPTSVREQQARQVSLQADTLESLLFDWLNELLWWFNGEQWIWRRAAVRVDRAACRLAATARGEPFEPARHATGPEIKAITWHHFGLCEDDHGWKATVIVDI
ncbi:MAG: archease [Candidatus Dadabacteria bacterium]|nr:MAG: archease [Candidatus Dadabacteria bacterium]